MIAEVLSNKEISENYYKMELRCPELVEGIIPGQFMMLRVRNGYEPYLRRPFSFYGIRSSSGFRIIEILYKIVGTGTKMMAGIKAKEKLDIIAPLGNGFLIPKDIKKIIIVSGGIGLAPLLFLAESIKRNNKTDIIFLYGGQSIRDIIDIERIEKVSSDVRICTEDGSMGSKMLVTQLLVEYLEKSLGKASGMIFSCGPKAMLRIVSSIAERYDIPCQVSLESFMACGFGACLGCVVKVKEKGNGIAYERVCKEGPVFDSKRIVWDE